MKYFILLAAALLVGCSTTNSDGSPRDFSGIQKALDEHNSQQKPTQYPKQTTCNTVGNRTTCTTY